MKLKTLPRAVTRPLSILFVIAWVGVMALLINRSYIQASTSTLATDLARYGSSAAWRGIYYRGEKIGFTVSQTVARDNGFELEEDGRLQMSLLGAASAVTIHTSARVDQYFALQSFEFSLDPGTGPINVNGRLSGLRLTLSVRTTAGTHTEERELPEPPALSQSLLRRLANGGLVTGAKHQWTVFDPATMRNAPVTLTVGRRELIRDGLAPIPAFRVEMEFGGLHTTSWVTDTGEVVREESPLGLITVRETADRARGLAVSNRMQTDLLNASAVIPTSASANTRIDETRDVRRLKLRLDGADLSGVDMQGVGQSVDGNVIEIVDPRTLQPGRPDSEASRYLAPEAFIESDAPEIVAEAENAVRGVTDTRSRAERLTRHVNALIEKKPTVGLPSAREVLRTRVGDCNEHTALFVAMARALKIPSRIAVGLVYVHGAFYYHAWPEVYIEERAGRGMWLPVDPTLNQFPSDATHLRLTRGGLDKQTAILPLIGRLKMVLLDVDLAPDSTPILVGRQPVQLSPLSIPIPKRESCCACFAQARPARSQVFPR